MTQEELLDRINANIKANGKEAITGTELNFVLVNIIGLIVDAGANWGGIGGSIPDQEDLVAYVSDAVSDYLKRDGSNANSNVTLDGYSLEAKSLHIKGTGGAGNLGLKHQSAGITASGGESALGADSSGNPIWKNDGSAQVEIELKSNKGAANGYVPLNSSALIDSTYLPSYVDDVLEFANLAAFPVTGESSKIYIALDTNLTYRWSGSAYVEISASLALGETSSTAYRGDRGKTAYDHSQATGNPHGTTAAEVGAVPTSRTVNGVALSSDIQINNFFLSGQPGLTNTATGGAVRFIGFSDNAINSVETVRRTIMPLACTAYKFKVYIHTSQPATGSSVFTIFKNGVSTSIQITIPAGSSAGVYEDNVNEVSFAENDSISVQWVNNASTASAYLVSLQIATK